MAGRAGASEDVAGAHAVYEVMQLLTLSLGIPPEAGPAATSDSRWTLVVAVAAQATMVLAATSLAVVRPGGRIRRAPPSGA